MKENKHHLVVFGATSFVGQILCRYLWKRHGGGGEVRWAMAGRSLAKLEQVRAELGSGSEALPLILADAADESALKALCAQTRVVISTVGPYALFGSPLVKVCAETGTDYCDLTGEVQWIARMIAAHESTAKKSGARIVHCSGFDSISSDLGVHFLQQQSRERFGEACTRVRLRIKSMRGTVSGGTVASMPNNVKEAVEDPAVRALMSDPYAFCPPGNRTPQHEVTFAEFDDDAGSWLAPSSWRGSIPASCTAPIS